MSTSESEQLTIPIATCGDETISDDHNNGTDGYYYDNGECTTKLHRNNNVYVNINDDIDIDIEEVDEYENENEIKNENEKESTNIAIANIAPNRHGKITGVVIAPQFNGKQVEILSYNENDETWTVQFEQYDNEMEKYLNIREEFLVFIERDKNNKINKNNCIESKENKKQWIRLQTCGYYILLALIVISCTCLLLTPFWSFSSLIFGRNDGYIYYLSYTFFCGLMCLIIWSKKLNLHKKINGVMTAATQNQNNRTIFAECRNCSCESIICYIFYMFCCILLWGMASYFGGFFFIYLWYCSQEIHSNYKRCNYFDIFMNKYQNNTKYNSDDMDIIKRSVCVYYYCLNNFQSNIHKIYKTFIINAYLTYQNNNEFKLLSNKMNIGIDINQIFYTKHWFPNINLSHNLPFIAGIAGYHFMIWFAVFYLNISDWSFLITVCNDILLLLCLFTALFINFIYYNKCKKQINLHCLTYFNLENIKKNQLNIINKECENLYLELNQRIESIEIIKELTPIHISDIIVNYIYLH